MLDKKYINALSALKAQAEGRFSNVKSLLQGCEAEAVHVYRIMHAHNTNIVDMNEDLLKRFVAEEVASGAPYPNPDRDGLQYVDSEKDVEVYPSCMQGNVCYPLENQSYTLRAHEAKAMLSQLVVMGKLSMITHSIQSLAQRDDGTQLQTAFPDIEEVRNCIQSGLELPEQLLAKIKEWESLGATEVNFDFVDLDG